MLKIVGVVANLLPPASALAYAVIFGTELPRPDDWVFIATLKKQAEGLLKFQDVWEPYFSHRLLFPKILMFAMAPLTKWSLRAEMLVNYCFLLATTVLLWGIFRRNRSRETLAGDLWVFLPINMIVFGFKQFENLIWGWQLQIGMSSFGILATIYCLLLGSRWAFFGGIASGVLASFSFASGLLVWPLGSLILFLQRKKPAQQLLWLFCGIVAITLYITNLVLPRMEAGHAGTRLGNLLFGFIALIGASLPLSGRATSAYPIWGLSDVQSSPAATMDMRVAGAVGALVLVCAAVILGLGRKGKTNPWLFLFLFGLGASLMIAFGRLQREPENALLSRYATLAGYAVIGAYGLAIIAWRENRSKKMIPVLLSLIVVSYSIALASEWGKYAPFRWAMDQRAINALVQQAGGIKIVDPQFQWIEGHEWIKKQNAILKELGYAFFAERR